MANDEPRLPAPPVINTTLFLSNFVSCDLWTTDKTFLAFLQSREEELKSELGYDFTWWEANKSGGIRAKHQVNDVFDPTEYDDSFNWLYSAVKKYQQVFPKYVREFKAATKN